MNEPEYEPDFKCATFDKSGITPEIRAKMDADRRRAEEERDKQDGQSVAGTAGVESAPVGSSAWLEPLIESWERRLSELNESVAMGSYNARHARNELETCIKDLRACAESGSNVVFSDGGGKPQPEK